MQTAVSADSVQPYCITHTEILPLTKQLGKATTRRKEREKQRFPVVQPAGRVTPGEPIMQYRVLSRERVRRSFMSAARGGHEAGASRPTWAVIFSRPDRNGVEPGSAGELV